MTAEIAGLFEAVALPDPYKTLEDELMAVAAELKATSVFPFEDLDANLDPIFHDILAASAAGRSIGAACNCP